MARLVVNFMKSHCSMWFWQYLTLANKVWRWFRQPYRNSKHARSQYWNRHDFDEILIIILKSVVMIINGLL